MRNALMLLAVAVLLLPACVSKKKLKAEMGKVRDAQASYERVRTDLNNCETKTANLQRDLKSKEEEVITKNARIKALEDQIKSLDNQLEYMKQTNTNLLDRMSDLSIVSKTGAESIKKSLEALNDQSAYIKDLNNNMQRKDSLNLALVMNLKRSLSDINDEDVQIEVKKGVVYVSISDKMLFKSGSSDINIAAETVLGKVAKVVNDYKELDILVEGHTDNVPISNSCVNDNWDLSAKRATAVVRMLQQKFGVKPDRMTAGGRSEYAPKSSNASADGRKVNRRTEIVILPKLDQFFELLQPQGK